MLNTCVLGMVVRQLCDRCRGDDFCIFFGEVPVVMMLTPVVVRDAPRHCSGSLNWLPARTRLPSPQPVARWCSGARAALPATTAVPPLSSAPAPVSLQSSAAMTLPPQPAMPCGRRPGRPSVTLPVVRPPRSRTSRCRVCVRVFVDLLIPPLPLTSMGLPCDTW